MSQSVYVWACCLGIAVSATLPGCSSAPAPAVTDSGDLEKLTKISNAYRDANLKLSRPPKNREELKPFLPGEADLDDLFRSANDGKPYVMIWGVVMDPEKIGPGPPAVIAFEQEGKGGFRYVATVNSIETMDQAGFAQANIPADKRP